MIVDPVTMRMLADEHVKEMRRMAQYGKGEPSQGKRASLRAGLLTLILMAFVLL